MPAPVIAAAALTAIGSLMGQMMQQQAQEEALREQRRQSDINRAFQREQDSKSRLANAQQGMIQTVGQMGQGEQGAIGQLMAALQRTQR